MKLLGELLNQRLGMGNAAKQQGRISFAKLKMHCCFAHGSQWFVFQVGEEHFLMFFGFQPFDGLCLVFF